MRRTRSFLLLALLLGCLVAAPEAEAHYENTYFPLHVGNEWNYSFADGRDALTVTVDESWVSPVTGQIWFRLREYNGDSHWLMQSAAGRVFEWPARQWYRFGAAAGSSWTMSIAPRDSIPCSNGARLEVVSRNETLKVPAGTFSTIHIRYSSSCRDAGITDEWFARGVGLVQRSQRSGKDPVVIMLERAVISGRSVCATCD
jgi:hypothetical protein